MRENKAGRIAHMFWSISNSAKRRGICCIVLKSDIERLIEKQEWKCARTGILFDLTCGDGKRPFGPTIDRIDNNRGYEPDNIQIVCWMYNTAKGQFRDIDVLTLARALVEQAN